MHKYFHRILFHVLLFCSLQKFWSYQKPITSSIPCFNYDHKHIQFIAQRRAYHYLADWILEYWTWKTSVNSSSAYFGTKTKDLTSPNLPQSRRSSSWRPSEGTPHTKRCWDSLFTVYTCRGHYLELACQGTYSAESKCTFPIIIAYVNVGNLYINNQ